MTALISPIYRKAPADEVADEARFEEARRDLWLQKRIVVVRMDELRHVPLAVRMALEAFAIGRWGKRA